MPLKHTCSYTFYIYKASNYIAFRLIKANAFIAYSCTIDNAKSFIKYKNKKLSIYWNNGLAVILSWLMEI